MRINITINDDTIRANVADAVAFLLEEEEINFGSDSEKDEFVSDCAENIIQKFMLYGEYFPNYENEVRDFYEMYY